MTRVGPTGREVSPDVVEACRQGDRDALRALYETYKDRVYSIALYYFRGDTASASDVTQQVFLKLMDGIGRYRGDSAFSTWLYRIVINACVDRSRRAQAFDCADGQIILAVGTDDQFQKLMKVLGRPDVAKDSRFVTNKTRKQNREALIPLLKEIFLTQTVAHWVEALCALAVPCGPVNDISQVFKDPQVQHRGMKTEMDHPTVGRLTLLGNPAKLSATPVRYRRPPPLLGQHTQEILREFAGADDDLLAKLAEKSVI